MINNNKNSYNKIASEWYHFRNNTKLHKYVVEFEKHLKAHSYILDLGCGTGYPNLTYLHEKGHFIYGVDIAKEMLKYAINLNLENTQFELVNFLEFKHEKKFDGVLAFDSLFHLPIDKHHEAFLKISSLINHGGYFMFTHGKTESRVEGFMYGEPFYYSTLDSLQMVNILKKEDFEILTELIDYRDEFGHRELIVIARKS